MTESQLSFLKENNLQALYKGNKVYVRSGGMATAFSCGWHNCEIITEWDESQGKWENLKELGYKEYPPVESKPQTKSEASELPNAVDLPEDNSVSETRGGISPEEEAERIYADLENDSGDESARALAKSKMVALSSEEQITSSVAAFLGSMNSKGSDAQIAQNAQSVDRAIRIADYFRRKNGTSGEKRWIGVKDAANVYLYFYKACSTYISYLIKDPPYQAGMWFDVSGGEKIYYKQEGIGFYETVSSTNESESFVANGDFYVTNKRFVFVTYKGPTSFPYTKIDSFRTNWLAGSKKGKIYIAVKDRVKKKIFCVGDSLGPALFYHYFGTLRLRGVIDSYVNRKTPETKGAAIGAIFELARMSLSEEKSAIMNAATYVPPSTSSTGGGGGGCCIPFIAMIGAVVWLAKMCIC